MPRGGHWGGLPAGRSELLSLSRVEPFQRERRDSGKFQPRDARLVCSSLFRSEIAALEVHLDDHGSSLIVHAQHLASTKHREGQEAKNPQVR